MLRNGRRSRSTVLWTRALALAALAAVAAGCGGTLRGLDYITQLGPLDSNPTKLVFVPCPTGTKVTGGGAYISPQITQLAVIRSEPGTGGNGWIAHAGEVVPYGGDWQVGATAICTKVAP